MPASCTATIVLTTVGTMLASVLPTDDESVAARSVALKQVFCIPEANCKIAAFETYLRRSVGQKHWKPATPANPCVLYSITQSAYAIEESNSFVGRYSMYETNQHVSHGLRTLSSRGKNIVLEQQGNAIYASLHGILELTNQSLEGPLADRIRHPRDGHAFQKYIETGVVDNTLSQEMVAQIQAQQDLARDKRADVIKKIEREIMSKIAKHHVRLDQEGKFIFNIHQVAYIMDGSAGDENKMRTTRSRIEGDVKMMPKVQVRCPELGKGEVRLIG